MANYCLVLLSLVKTDMTPTLEVHKLIGVAEYFNTRASICAVNCVVSRDGIQPVWTSSPEPAAKIVAPALCCPI